MDTTTFEQQLERVAAGTPLTAAEVESLAAAPDILPLGMLADAAKRRAHGTRVTYARVALCPFDRSFVDAVAPGAREVRITGTPDTLDVALTAVRSARAVAGDRALSGYTWPDIVRLAEAAGLAAGRVLERLREAGLDALAGIPLDEIADPPAAVEALAAAGFGRLCLTVQKGDPAARTSLLRAAAGLQQRYGCIQALNPLPMTLNTFRPTTGYDDVKTVALARLAAPGIPSIQIDWPRYGPKLAQVALTFGADDLDAVSPLDDAPEGRRRAPLEEVRRNIEAAGFMPVERDGRFHPLA